MNACNATCLICNKRFRGKSGSGRAIDWELCPRHRYLLIARVCLAEASKRVLSGFCIGLGFFLAGVLLRKWL